MELFNAKGNVKCKDIFRETVLLFFIKNKHIFEGNMSYSLVGNTFQSKLVSEQTLITATVINYKIILVLYDLNSTNQAY